MANRQNLHKAFEDILGSKNVYFQPTSNTAIKYPCIIYLRDSSDMKYANDMPYLFENHYNVTFVSRDPNDPTVKAIAMAFPTIRHSNTYVNDNLYHDQYNLYY